MKRPTVLSKSTATTAAWDEASCNRQFFGEGTAAYSQGHDGADRMPKVYGEAALAHLAVSDMYLTLPEVLLHRLIALWLVTTHQNPNKDVRESKHIKCGVRFWRLWRITLPSGLRLTANVKAVLPVRCPTRVRATSNYSLHMTHDPKQYRPEDDWPKRFQVKESHWTPPLHVLYDKCGASRWIF